MDVKNIQIRVEDIFRKYYVKFAGLFGSRARGEETSGSDTDLLVEFEKAPSLVMLTRFENELASALNTKVDVVIRGTEKNLLSRK